MRAAKQVAKALDFRNFTNGHGVQKAREVVRQYVAHLAEDRPLYPDHNRMKALVHSGEILDEVEKAIGSLEWRVRCTNSLRLLLEVCINVAKVRRLHLRRGEAVRLVSQPITRPSAIGSRHSLPARSVIRGRKLCAASLWDCTACVRCPFVDAVCQSITGCSLRAICLSLY